MNEKLQLALDEFIHVGVVLVVIIALVSVLTGLIRAFIPQEKLQKKLSKTGRFGSLMGALLGVPTPFCSASMVPVSMGMVEMGAPFSMIFAFLVSAPLANFVVVGFIFGVFGWKVALTYFLIVFLGAIIAGSFWGKTKIKQALRHRRISDTHIERALEEVSEHAETDNLHQILARKSEGLKPDMEGLEKRNKLIRFGLGRGYSLDQILPCLEEILGKQVF